MSLESTSPTTHLTSSSRKVIKAGERCQVWRLVLTQIQLSPFSVIKIQSKHSCFKYSMTNWEIFSYWEMLVNSLQDKWSSFLLRPVVIFPLSRKLFKFAMNKEFDPEHVSGDPWRRNLSYTHHLAGIRSILSSAEMRVSG